MQGVFDKWLPRVYGSPSLLFKASITNVDVHSVPFYFFDFSVGMSCVECVPENVQRAYFLLGSSPYKSVAD